MELPAGQVFNLFSNRLNQSSSISILLITRASPSLR
jgi:hypothetical protein